MSLSPQSKFFFFCVLSHGPSAEARAPVEKCCDISYYSIISRTTIYQLYGSVVNRAIVNLCLRATFLTCEKFATTQYVTNTEIKILIAVFYALV